MADKTIPKIRYAMKTYTLADGTKKQYRSKCIYYVTEGGKAVNHRPEKLTDIQKNEIWQKFLEGNKKKDLAIEYGVSAATISSAINAKRPQKK